MPASNAWQDVAELECWLALMAGVVDDMELVAELIFRGAEIEAVFEKAVKARRNARRLRDRMAAAWPQAQGGARDSQKG